MKLGRPREGFLKKEGTERGPAEVCGKEGKRSSLVVLEEEFASAMIDETASSLRPAQAMHLVFFAE